MALRDNGRGRATIVLGIVVLFTATLLLPAEAVHEEGLFELDGNKTNESSPGADWDDLGSTIATTESFLMSWARATTY